MSPPLNIPRLAVIVGAHARASTATLVAVLAATVALHFALPPRYTAEAAVVVHVPAVGPAPGAAEAPGVVPHNVLGTHASMARSDGVARQVVRRLSLVDDARLHDAWQRATQGRGDAEAWIARRLLRSLDVRPDAADSNVLLLRFSHAEPATAATLVNAFAQAYLATVMSLRSDPARLSADHFAGQVAALQARLELAQERLLAYQRHHGIAGGSERLQAETAALQALDQGYAEARTPLKAAMRSSLEAQRERVLELKAVLAGLAVLERDVDGARQAYEQARTRQAAVGGPHRGAVAEASLLSVGVVPSEPARPGLAVLMPMAGVLGTLLAVLLALALDRRRPLLEHPHDLLAWGVPMLAEVPHARFPRRAPATPPRLRAQAAAA